MEQSRESPIRTIHHKNTEKGEQYDFLTSRHILWPHKIKHTNWILVVRYAFNVPRTRVKVKIIKIAQLIDRKGRAMCVLSFPTQSEAEKEVWLVID